MPLPGYIQDPTEDAALLDALIPGEASSRTAAVTTLLTGGTTGSLTSLTVSEIGRQADNLGVLTGLRERPRLLSADEANELYGIDGELRFAGVVRENEAAWRHDAKRDELFRRDVLSRSDLGPLSTLGLGLAGAMIDPVTLPLNMLGIGAATRIGLLGAATTRLGAVSRGLAFGALEGAAGGLIGEGLTYGLAGLREGRDYTTQDLVLGVAASAIFGAGFEGTLSMIGWRAPEVHLGERVADAPVFEPPPRIVAQLDDDARAGALAKALDDMAEDRPVEIGQLIDRELETGPGPRPELDDVQAGAELPARWLEPDMAVTVRGTEVPVRYALVEVEDLVTSHSDDLVRNPAFPDDLQPRARERAGSQARLLRMEKEFSPRRLTLSPDAESGAPIVSPDGVVESGNGRTIVLRRNARRETEQWKAYRAELERLGFDLSGMESPVLVRVRTQAMTGGERVRLAREMNADVTERLSATEQAFEDAKTISDEDFGLYAGGEVTAAANRKFAQRFADRAGAGQENAIVDAGTLGLTQEGGRRIEAALLAKAYGDRELVYAVHETADANIRTVGQALTAAAPDWARMRAAAARGELADGVDPTDALTAAVALVRHARDRRLDLKELIEVRLGQTEMFGGEALSPATEWFLRLFFRDGGFKKHSSAGTIAEALQDYARQAMETTPGPSLFGDADVVSAEQILEHVVAKSRGHAAADGERVGQPGGPPGDRPAGGVRSGDRGAADGGGGSAGGVDPELKALQDDTAALEFELEAHVRDGTLTADEAAAALAESRPAEVVSEAVRAAAFCLREG